VTGVAPGTGRPDPAAVAEQIRAVLAAIEAGDITADLDHVAYLRGAADVLALLGEPDSGDRPGSLGLGRGVRDTDGGPSPQVAESR